MLFILENDGTCMPFHKEIYFLVLKHTTMVKMNTKIIWTLTGCCSLQSIH